ncbi:sulfotransferase domain-containing protein [Salinibacter ruber]|uniref:sulfotransferase domain-containing protein n=1 Tax=Salinibacter ruber TaxID=146919 RepID=UPI000E6D25BE|nr:sulfotransferase domain-containing protein [Salinibacter ruber]
MALPNFLGIGAQRCGTTWLDANLRTHPHIYLPASRKEVQFFDCNYERGNDWYESYFPDEKIESHHQAIGEVTAMYLSDPSCPGRIAEQLPSVNLIAVLRNPVDRAYSHYGLRIRDQGIQTDFRSFIEQNPEVIERGKYVRQLHRYLDHFSRDQLLIIVFEWFIQEPATIHRKIGDFLGIPPDLFSVPEQQQKKNSSYIPRFPRLRASARRVGKSFRKYGFDRVVEWAKAVGIDRMFGNVGSLPSMRDEDRRYLAEQYAQEIEQVEALLDRDLGVWKSANAIDNEEQP